MRILILGGTSEAFALAQHVAVDARLRAVYSLAGRTASPLLPPVPHRIGGFGGVQGLECWLAGEGIEAIIDATHPFAARMSANAAAAARSLRLPLLVLRRAPWRPQAGDDWIRVADAQQAAVALGPEPAKVFLAIGRLELAAFRAAPQHSYLVRAVDAPEPNTLPPRAHIILQRGPFEVDAERDLLRSHAIDIVVSKNSGGEAAYAKIAAARQLGLPVVMVDPPPAPQGRHVESVASALDWLDVLIAQHHSVVSERGV